MAAEGGLPVSPTRILVAEDDAVTRALVVRVLTDSGYDVLAVEDGDAALAEWGRHRPPIVLTDYMMPGTDGPELCRRIRQSDADSYTYIIVLTSRDDQEGVLTGLQAGADDYVKKPFDRNELLLRVSAGERVVKLEIALADKVRRLEDALKRVRTLEGILPTCSYCGRIREEDGSWAELESYVRHRTDAEFSHGYCPDCVKEHVLPQFEHPPERLMALLEESEDPADA